MQKNKDNENVLKLIGNHDFSKIKDMSKNRVFKNLSNNSTDGNTSGSGEEKNDISNNILLSITEPSNIVDTSNNVIS